MHSGVNKPNGARRGRAPLPAIQMRRDLPHPSAIQPSRSAAGLGGLAGAALGFAIAGPAGIPGALLAGAVLAPVARWWYNLPNNVPQPGQQAAPPPAAMTVARPRQVAPALVPPRVRPTVLPVHAGPARVYQVGDLVEIDEADTVRTALDAENAANAQAYQTAVQLTAQLQNARRAWGYDRDPNYVPTQGGNLVQVVLNGRTQAYLNRQNYFPGAGAPYQEHDVNAPVGDAGNWREIRPAAPVALHGQNYTRWVGRNITHPGGHWVCVWNQTGGLWQQWNTALHTAVNVALHVGGPQPPDNRTAQQRLLAQNGYTRKTLEIQGFQLKVKGTQIGGPH